MKKALVFITLAFLALGCAGCPVQIAKPPEKTFFDASVVQTFTPGKTTRADVQKALGQPYPDPLKSDNRWTYMYTHQKQLILFFDNGVLSAHKWSEEYGIGIP